ncbi:MULTISPECIES: YjjG family noncanonical pyrimidine nucleotidase [Vitreoscilla]|uniref:YjjG family noncanonical pyrimidine nucleotidase n=1 Tax=Vitreoscilla stercoraria TaxID=61 RepID=A0ABY4E9H4_VITST|nr:MULTISPECIES: YjjG family noncanonical pyrimidine nucleotidase [Vitreoscilla]AUZ06231.1 HAD-hydrolase [Vitreoscilla sp. C1]UOO92410.1 YjjG family noncanonical pyrimidine nucleotidase [Vitreoscilla stercoraria]
MAYQAVFFDIDDTLLNFGQSGKRALQQTFADYELLWDEQAQTVFTELNDGLWAKQKQGLMKVHEVINSRFGLFFEAMNWQDLDATAVTLSHQNNLSQQSVLEHGALELVQQVSATRPIYAASNSMLALQTKRLNQAQLLPYFTDLYISSDIGYEKPDARFFETCLQRSGLAADEVLFVGDSVEADMVGALNSGMDMCWYNPKQNHLHVDIEPTYQISALSQLLQYL